MKTNSQIPKYRMSPYAELYNKVAAASVNEWLEPVHFETKREMKILQINIVGMARRGRFGTFNVVTRGKENKDGTYSLYISKVARE